jgi:hypothetical protein
MTWMPSDTALLQEKMGWFGDNPYITFGIVAIIIIALWLWVRKHPYSKKR